MTISYRITSQGAYELSALVNGYLETQQYMGYTKKESTQLFREFIKDLKGDKN